VDAGLRQLMGQIDDATQRLLRTTAGLTAEEVRQPSLLPGWSRGHVLSHVARNADGLRNLLIWARTGTRTPMYPSPQAREQGIEAGAGRGPAEQAADLTATADAFRAEAMALPEPAWQVLVATLNDPPFPATHVLTRRLVEVELHHADLGAGYSPADWPEAFTAMDLGAGMNALRQTRLTA
jgi:maleylpyruvate isomerase